MATNDDPGVSLNDITLTVLVPDTGESSLIRQSSSVSRSRVPSPTEHQLKNHLVRGYPISGGVSSDLWNISDWNSSYLFNMSSNNSGDSFEEAYREAQNVYIVIYSLLVIVAVIGNSCTMYVVVSRRKMRNVTNYFIASLAVSDILMALLCVPFTFIANVLVNYWPFGEALCPLVSYIMAAVVFQNAYTLLAMSLERYIAIMHPFFRRLGKKRCLQVVSLCWMLAFLTPIPTAATSRLVTIYGGNSTEGVTYCLEDWKTESQRFSYSLAVMVLQYFVPLAVLIFTYAKIVHVVWLKDIPPTPGHVIGSNQEHLVMDSNPGPGNGKFDDQPVGDPRKKVIKMMLTVVGIYAICWLPLHALNIAYDVNNNIYDQKYMRFVWIAAHWLAMSSCAYNPFIYWWMNPKFREGYLILIDKIRHMLCYLCTLENDDRKRRHSLSSKSSQRFLSRFGNGSILTLTSRRHSATQMVDLNAVSCDGSMRNSCNNGHNHDLSSKSLLRDVEFGPELSKISEVTENGSASLNYFPSSRPISSDAVDT